MEAIERLAEAFLARVHGYVWDGMSIPVPVEDIADTHAGLLVRDVDDLAQAPGAPRLGNGQTLSGLLLPALGEIWVNADEARQWPPRRRFTIAHELGHWCLHRDSAQAAYCRPTSIEPETAEQGAPIPLAEEQANAFAAALLMPAQLIRQQYARCDGDVLELCRVFAASGAAMNRRLQTVVPPGRTPRP